MRRCGSCSDLVAPFGVDLGARSCRHGLTILQEELDFGEWCDTQSTLSESEINAAVKECEYFHVPLYL